MTIIRSWGGAGLAAGALSTSTAGTGDTAFSSINGGGGFAVTADGPRSPRITYPATAAAHQLRWNTLGALAAYAVRRYFTVTTVPAATWSVVQGLTSVGGDLFRVEFNSTGLLRFRSATAAVYSAASNPVVADTLYRLEIVGTSGGAARAYLYLGESTTPLVDTGAVTVTAGAVDEIRWGHQTAVAVAGETADDLAIGDVATLIGPAETPKAASGALTCTQASAVSLQGRKATTAALPVSAPTTATLTGRKTAVAALATSATASASLTGRKTTTSVLATSTVSATTLAGAKTATGALTTTAAAASTALGGRKASAGALTTSQSVTVALTAARGAGAALMLAQPVTTTATGYKATTGALQASIATDTAQAGYKATSGALAVVQAIALYLAGYPTIYTPPPPTPPTRTTVIPAELRVLAVTAESRTVTIPADQRTLEVPA